MLRLKVVLTAICWVITVLVLWMLSLLGLVQLGFDAAPEGIQTLLFIVWLALGGVVGCATGYVLFERKEKQ